MITTLAMAKTSKIIKFVKIFLSAFILALVILNFQQINSNLGFLVSKAFAALEDEQLVYNYSGDPIDPIRLPISGTFAENTEAIILPNSATIVIDKLGITAPLVFDATNDVNDIFDSLREGIVNHPITPKPGEKGMSILLGHSSSYAWDDNPYGSVFALLDKLEVGDRFHIKYSDGRTFYYEMKESLIFNPFDPNDTALQEFEKKDKTGVALVSCWPTGTSLRRLAVRAEQI